MVGSESITYNPDNLRLTAYQVEGNLYSGVENYLPEHIQAFREFWSNFLKTKTGQRLSYEGLTSANYKDIAQDFNRELQFAKDNELINKTLANCLPLYLRTYTESLFG